MWDQWISLCVSAMYIYISLCAFPISGFIEDGLEMRTRGRMVPTRGRGGRHDWIVDALLSVDRRTMSIRLLLSRIKAVWGTMRHVHGVVAIVMVHEVEREELDGLVRRIYTRKKKDSRAEKRKKEGEEEREERRGNGHWLESKGRGDEVRFDFSNNVYVLSKIRFYIYFYFSQCSLQRDDPSEWHLVNER